MKILLSRLLSVTFLICCIVPAAWAGDALVNLDDAGVAIGGYDAVSYFSGKAQQGQTSLSHQHEGAIYRFATEENREKFIAEPEKFLPAYGGWCAWAMLEGEKIKIDPESFKIVDGVTYLFYDGFWGDTLKKWNELAAREGEKNLVVKADGFWREITSN